MYSQQFKVRSNEIDVDLSISYPSIIRMMQETSMQHIIKLKASFWDMKEQQTSWVLLKKEVNFIGTPGMNDTVEVQTYPSGFNKIFAFRDYHMYDDQGNKIAEASSLWTMIDLNTRKPIRIDSRGFDEHIPKGIDFMPRADFRLRKLEQTDVSRSYQVAFYDLDWNGHANNTFLTTQILSSIQQRFHTAYKMHKLSIQFKTECFYGDELTFDCHQISDTEIHHQVIRKSDQKEICLAKTLWQKK